MENFKIQYTKVTKDKTYLEMLKKNLPNVRKVSTKKNQKNKKPKPIKYKKYIKIYKNNNIDCSFTDKVNKQIKESLVFSKQRYNSILLQRNLFYEAKETKNRIYIDFLVSSINLSQNINEEILKFSNNLKFKEVVNIYDNFKLELNKIFINHNNNKIRETLLSQIYSETLNKSYAEASNNLNIKTNINISSNTLIDHINKENKDLKIYDKIIEVLLSFINKVKTNENVYAVDGTNLAMSKKLTKDNYPYQRYTKLVDKAKINKIKEDYKNKLKEIKTEHDNKKGKYKKENKKNFKMTKEQLLKETREMRDKEIKEIKININETIRKNNEENKKGLYCRALCTSLYDVNNCFSLALEETNNYANENNHIVEILNKINLEPNSTILFDRKYYSKSLLKYLNEKNIIPIFRLDIDNNFVRLLNKENKNEIIKNIVGIDVKIIKYSIENKDYYILTTNLNLTIEEIKVLYHKRWLIEEYYKVQKHKMKGWFYNKHNKDNYLGSLKAQHIGHLFSRFMYILAEKFNILLKPKRKNTKENKYPRKINFKEAINISIEHILYDSFNFTENKNILNLLEKINKTRYSEIQNRKFKRKTILSKGRWDFEKT